MDGVSQGRTPNFASFIATGAVIGALVGGLISIFSGNPARLFSENAALGVMAVTFGVLGAILGGLAGVLTDIAIQRRRGS